MTRTEWEADVHRRGGIVVGNLPAQAGINMAGQLGARFGDGRTAPIRWELAPFALRSGDRLDSLLGMLQIGAGKAVEARDAVKNAAGSAVKSTVSYVVVAVVLLLLGIYFIERKG